MHFKLSFLAIFLGVFCHLTSAQVPFPSKCPEVKIVDDFDLDAYMGIWYENTKYPFIFEIGKRCMYAIYGNNCNATVSVMNAAINILTEQPSNVTGIAKVIGPGRLAVSFSKHDPGNRANYNVLGTDYTSYAVVYSCTQVMTFMHTKVVWILTRERQPSEDAIKKAKKIMQDNDLSETFLVNSDQENCPPPAHFEHATECAASGEDTTTDSTTVVNARAGNAGNAISKDAAYGGGFADDVDDEILNKA